MAKSHYLENDRLANVIAAIQIFGLSEQTSATLDHWVAELEASEELTPEQRDQTPVKFAERKKWATVFEQHPEFFKTYALRGEQRVLLRWRYAQSLNSSPKDKASPEPEEVTPEDATANAVPSSKPLSPDQIQVLIDTAFEFYAKQAAAERSSDQLPPLTMAAVGAALGTIGGGLVVVVLGWMQLIHVARIFD
ncbi:MAG: hypothetical protein WEA28_02520 [Xanthobacteraceae bacterium]